MQALALAVLPVLLRTTLGLALATAVVELVLRVARPQSPRVHRVGWLTALAVGWAFVGWAVEVPWYPASATPASGPVIEGPAVTTTPAEPVQLPRSPAAREVDTAAAAGAIASSPPALEMVSVRTDPPSLDAASLSTRDAQVTSASPSPPGVLWSSWPVWLTGIWVVGMLAAVGSWLVAYVRFISLVRRARGADAAAPSPWQDEWRRLLDENHVRREIPLVATAHVGPSLCRLTRGYVLLVPREAWGSMSSAMRQAILRHELAHLLRGDVWWSLAARMLALPHWFNPAAWRCVRRFDEAAEWACDRAAINGLPATEFAALLVNLGAATQPHASFNPAARGRGLATRVRRLLAGESREDSTMKKLCVLITAALVIVVSVVRFELVAQEPASAPRAPEAPAAGAPAAAPRAVAAPSLALTVEAADDGSRGLTKELVDVSQQGFKAALLSYQNGNESLELVCDWSRRWLAADLELDSDPARQVEHCRAHLKRMEKLHQHVEKLHKAAAQGGEPERLALTSYYVVQAKRDLAKAEHRAQRLELEFAPADERLPAPTSAPPTLVPTPTATPRPPALAPEPALAPQPRPALPESVDVKSARYDGKSFSEWVAVLHQELSPARRAVAIEALTAFAADDKGLAALAAPQVLRVMRGNRTWYGTSTPAGSMYVAATEFFRSTDREVVLPILVEALQSEEASTRRFALQVFDFAVEPPHEALPKLVALAKDDDPKIRRVALYAIAGIDRASPAIVAALEDENPMVVLAAIESLMPQLPFDAPRRTQRIMPLDAEGAVHELKSLAARESTDPMPQIQAINALGRFGPAVADAIQILERSAVSPNSDVAAAAAAAIKQIRQSSPARRPVDGSATPAGDAPHAAIE